MDEIRVYGTYLGHSGFVIDHPRVTMIFDWHKSNLPAIRQDKPLCIFISHIHSDHMNKDVFAVAGDHPDSYVFIGYDHSVPGFDAAIKKQPQWVQDRITYFDGQQEKTVNAGGCNIIIKTLTSTDMGVAFLVEVEGKKYFHAGDLFLMQTMDSVTFKMQYNGDEKEWIQAYYKYLEQEEELFKEYTEPLKGVTIDYAMIPVDPRYKGIGYKTLKRYMDIADIRLWSPMHLWDSEQFVDKLLEEHPEYAGNMIGPSSRDDVCLNAFAGKRYNISDQTPKNNKPINDVSKDSPSKNKEVAKDNSKSAVSAAKGENADKEWKQYIVFAIAVILLIAGIVAFAWRYTHPTSSATNDPTANAESSESAAKTDTDTQSVTLKDFEKLGFYYSESASEFDDALPDGRSIHIGMALQNADKDTLLFLDDFSYMFYILASTPNKHMGMLLIAGDGDKIIDLGNGYSAPEDSLNSALAIAIMIAKDHENPFISCFPEDIAEVIREKNGTVVLYTSISDDTKEKKWNLWRYEINLNRYYLDEDNNKQSVIIPIEYYFGEETVIQLGYKNAEYLFGKKTCESIPELYSLYAYTNNRISESGNSLDRSTMTITFSEEGKQALLELLNLIPDSDEGKE